MLGKAQTLNKDEKDHTHKQIGFKNKKKGHAAQFALNAKAAQTWNSHCSQRSPKMFICKTNLWPWKIVISDSEIFWWFSYHLNSWERRRWRGLGFTVFRGSFVYPAWHLCRWVSKTVEGRFIYGNWDIAWHGSFSILKWTWFLQVTRNYHLMCKMTCT